MSYFNIFFPQMSGVMWECLFIVAIHTFSIIYAPVMFLFTANENHFCSWGHFMLLLWETSMPER